jgi:hypothetical protein
VIFLADTTCILALYMITQTMTHVLGQLVPLYSAGIVIYRRFCRVSRCFHIYSVTCENLNTCAHLNPPHTPDLHVRYCQDLGVQSTPELVASQRKRVRRTPRGGVLTENDSSAAPASRRMPRTIFRATDRRRSSRLGAAAAPDVPEMDMLHKRRGVCAGMRVRVCACPHMHGPKAHQGDP